MPAYKSYRLFFLEGVGGERDHMAVREWKLFEQEDASSPNVLTGGTASSSGHNDTNVPERAFDGNESTGWGSLRGVPQTWLRYDLPEPVEVRSLYLSRGGLVPDRPKRFLLEGSNDGGVTWHLIADIRDFLSGDVDSRTISVVRNIQGLSLLSDGTPAPLVRIMDYDSGKLLYELRPDSEGRWHFSSLNSERLLIVQIPPEGYRPLADGPITIAPNW